MPTKPFRLQICATWVYFTFNYEISDSEIVCFDGDSGTYTLESPAAPLWVKEWNAISAAPLLLKGLYTIYGLVVGCGCLGCFSCCGLVVCLMSDEERRPPAQVEM